MMGPDLDCQKGLKKVKISYTQKWNVVFSCNTIGSISAYTHGYTRLTQIFRSKIAMDFGHGEDFDEIMIIDHIGHNPYGRIQIWWQISSLLPVYLYLTYQYYYKITWKWKKSHRINPRKSCLGRKMVRITGFKKYLYHFSIVIVW